MTVLNCCKIRSWLLLRTKLEPIQQEEGRTMKGHSKASYFWVVIVAVVEAKTQKLKKLDKFWNSKIKADQTLG